MTAHEDGTELVLGFEGPSKAEANLLAADLSDFLRERAPVEPHLRRDDPHAQDFGATIVLILSASSVTAIAKAIGIWVQRHREAEARLQVGDVTLELKNVDAQTLSSLVEKALQRGLD